jgi:PmbA protein
MININDQDLIPIVEQTIQEALKQGADQASVHASYSTGLVTSIRNQDVENLEHTQDKSLNITVYFNQHKGSTNTSDFSPSSIKLAVKKACDIAKFTSKDPFSGIADKIHLGKNDHPLDLYHPWTDLSSEKAIDIAKLCEYKALENTDISLSEGATLESYQTQQAYGNSHGFMDQNRQTRHGLSISLVSSAQSGQMQRDYSYTSARSHKDLWSPQKVANLAVERTLQKCNPQKVQTGNYPVIFKPEMARTLLNSFISAISGMAQYKKTTFLLDSVNQKLFPSFINIEEKPFIKKGLASQNYDAEGIPTQECYLIKEGVLQNYLLSSYSARALNLTPSGHTGGTSNLIVSNSDTSFNEMVKRMHKGVVISEMMGQGVNPLTGDYSRGASGFWVENGEIQYPIDEFTIAGNLKDMYKNIISVGNDIDDRSATKVGSILIENLMIAGN